MRAAGDASSSPSTQPSSSEPAAQSLLDQEQNTLRNALHTVPDAASSGRSMPEGDQDIEMLNSVSGSQPEAQLVTDKPTELPEGVQVEAAPSIQKAKLAQSASPAPDLPPLQSAASASESASMPSPASPDAASDMSATSAPETAFNQNAAQVSIPTTDAAPTSEAAPLPEAAPVIDIASVQSTAAAAAPAADSNTLQISNKDWDAVMQQFLDMLQLKGHFKARVDVNAFSIAVLKKGILDFARSRQDLLFSLPEAKIKAVLQAGAPYEERKLTIATKRLSTIFGDREGFLGPDGSFQDLTRFIIAAAYSHAMHKGRVQSTKPTDQVEWDSHKYNAALTAAMTDLLPDIITAAQEPPRPESVAKAEASALVREQKALTPPPIEHKKVLRPSNAMGEARPENRRQDRSRFFMEKGWEGFDGAAAGRNDNSNTRPGDWTCPDCSQHNFARNTECFKCGAPKSGAASPRWEPRQDGAFGRQQPSFGGDEVSQGDWNCSECGTNNFAKRSRCFKCGIPRSKAELGQGQKPGDWSCPSCGANNFSRRTDCFRCQTAKPADDSYRSRGRADSFDSPNRSFDSPNRSFDSPTRSFSPPARFDRAPRDGNRQPFQYEAKPGDWDCESCGASNFAKRGVCFKCGSAKTGGASTMSTSGRAAGRVFEDKRQENSWFDGSDVSDDFGPSTSSSNRSSSGGWDPRTSLGAAQPQPNRDFGRSSSPPSRGFDRAQPDFGRSASSSRGGFDRGSGSRSGGSSWERGGATGSRGRQNQSRGRQGGSAGRGRNMSTRPENEAIDLPGADRPWEGRSAPKDDFDFDA